MTTGTDTHTESRATEDEEVMNHMQIRHLMEVLLQNEEYSVQQLEHLEQHEMIRYLHCSHRITTRRVVYRLTQETVVTAEVCDTTTFVEEPSRCTRDDDVVHDEDTTEIEWWSMFHPLRSIHLDEVHVEEEYRQHGPR